MLVVLLVRLGIISERVDCAPSLAGGPSVPLSTLNSLPGSLGPRTSHVQRATWPATRPRELVSRAAQNEVWE